MLELRIHPPEPGKVTHRWDVISSGTFLGVISWYAQWRRYCFFPQGNTLYDSDCLLQLYHFCNDFTLRRKQERDAARSG